MVAQDYPGVGVWMAVAGGILMIIEGISIGGIFALGTALFPGIALDALAAYGTWAIINGIIVIVFAGYIAYNPMASWSAYVTLVFSAISFVFLGGYIVGGILGIVGAAYILAWETFRPGVAPQAKEATVTVPR